jgi:hypothetical protein
MSKVVSITKNKSADLKAIRKALAVLEAEKILYKEIYALKTKPVEENNHSTWQGMISAQIKVQDMTHAYKEKYGDAVNADYEGVHSQ